MNIIKKIFLYFKNHPIFVYWDPVYLLMACIMFFSLMPRPFETVGVENVEAQISFNLLHVIAYFTLSFLLGSALRHSRHKIFREKSYCLAIIFAFSFSLLNEILQLFVPDRYFSLMDIFINIGSIVFAQIVRFILRVTSKFLEIIL